MGSTALPPEYLTENRWDEFFVPTTITFGLATLAIILRFASGLVVQKSYWYDDYCALVAWICGTGVYLTAATVWKDLRFGRHIAVAMMTVGPDVIPRFFKSVLGMELLYAMTITSCKWSIIALLWRIFGKTKMRVYLMVLLLIVTSWGIAVIFACIFTCIPVQALWDISITDKKCIDLYAFYVGITIPNMLTDFALVLLPIPFVWPLQVSTKQRILISFTLIAGGATSIVSAIRLSKILNNFSLQDPTWDSVTFMMWSFVENYCAIISICLPTLRPLLRWATGHNLSSAPDASRPSKPSAPSIALFSSNKKKTKYRSADYEADCETGSKIHLAKSASQHSYDGFGTNSYPMNVLEPSFNHSHLR